MSAYGWKSCPAKAIAGGPEPSLAGVAVTRGLKRRQGSCGMRDGSSEISKIAEAESVKIAEGNRSAVDKCLLPPESWSASRTKGWHRNLGGPAGAVGMFPTGVVYLRGKTGAAHRAEAGSRTAP